jgi:hypothetical protein
LAELSSSASGDWKVAQTRRLESLRYPTASPASVSGLRQVPRHNLRATAWTSASQFSRRQRTAGEELALLLAPITLKAKAGREGRQLAIITAPTDCHDFRRNRQRRTVTMSRFPSV